MVNTPTKPKKKNINQLPKYAIYSQISGKVYIVTGSKGTPAPNSLPTIDHKIPGNKIKYPMNKS
jgi:hypothetical protein